MADYGGAYDPTLGYYGSNSYGTSQQNAPPPYLPSGFTYPSSPTTPTTPTAPTTGTTPTGTQPPIGSATGTSTFTPGPGFTNTAPTLPNLIPGQPPVSIANKMPDGTYPVLNGREWIIWKGGIPTLTLVDPNAKTTNNTNPGTQIFDPSLYAPFTTPPPVFKQPPPFQAPTLDEAAAQPGYQFGLQQGEQALQQSVAARGLLRTGGTLKGILDYGRNAATQNYANVLGQDLGIYNTNLASQYQVPFDNAFTTFNAAQNEFRSNQTDAFNKYLQLIQEANKNA
jgi:hypothetical protein